MISVIVCSINKAFAEQLNKNINDTIGVPWELILIDNNELKTSIAGAYNLGATRSRYDLLCFVHEDVLFKDKGWGKTVERLFQNDIHMSVVGVAGSRYKSRTLSGWYTGATALDCCNILHMNEKNEEALIYANPDPLQKLQQVVSMDGVFICTRKDVWKKIRFDESLLKGFHCYDIDFSVRAAVQHTLAVTYEINMVHLTEGGSFGNNWMDNTILWHRSHENILPLHVDRSKPSNWKNIEVNIARNWLTRLKPEPISFGRRINWVIQTRSFYHIQLWPAILIFFVFRPVKKFLSIFRS
jgi:Glycosyltransferase like family